MMRSKLCKLLVISMVMAFALCLSSEAAVYTFNPTGDTYVSMNDSAALDTNYGSESLLKVGDIYGGGDFTGTYDFYRTLTFFDLSGFSLATGETITSASLNLYQTSITGADDIKATIILSSWSEGTVTWHTHPSYNGLASSLYLAGSGGWRAWTGLETVVEGWLNNPASNFGLLLDNDMQDDWNEFTASFYSSNYSDSELWPYLQIETDNGEYDDFNEAPEPASMILLGSLATGLFGVAGVRKRFTRK